MKDRNLNFDIFRLMLSLMIVTLHVSASRFLYDDVNSKAFIFSSFYDVIVRYAVPIFVMISGYFVLNSSFDFQKTLKKNLHLFIIYVSWAALYALGYMLLSKDINIGKFLSLLVPVQYHLWFIPALVCCYLLSPFAFALKEEKYRHLLKYIITIFFIFGILRFTLLEWFDYDKNTFVASIIRQYGIYNASNLFYYFILGYYLSTIKCKLSQTALLGLFTLLCLLNTALTVYLSRLAQAPIAILFHSFNIVVFLQAILVFKFFENLKLSRISPSLANYIPKLSKLTFGVYLIHPIFVEYAKHFSTLMALHSSIYIPFVTLGIFFISMLITKLCI